MRQLTLLLALVLIPSQALAECAWVLWEETSDVLPNRIEPVRSWGILIAVETKTECEDVLMATSQGAVDQYQRSKGEEVHSRRGYVEVIQKDQQGKFLGKTTHLWKCLPDTVDPRGKKD